jgi:hypothetical protein
MVSLLGVEFQEDFGCFHWFGALRAAMTCFHSMIVLLPEFGWLEL